MGSMISTVEARESVQDGSPVGPSGSSPGFLPPAAAAIAKQQGVRNHLLVRAACTAYLGHSSELSVAGPDTRNRLQQPTMSSEV